MLRYDPGNCFDELRKMVTGPQSEFEIETTRTVTRNATFSNEDVITLSKTISCRGFEIATMYILSGHSHS
jgi:hypothetical protein